MASEEGVYGGHPCSFDEFRLYYESTERVTDRRLAANRWNYSISVGILLSIAAIYGWAASNEHYVFVAGLVIIVLAAIAALFCLFWLRQIEDWKALNGAKFEVLNGMANRLRFCAPNGTSRARSFQPFDKEWAILKDEERLRKVRIMNLGQIEALNASGAELFMPRAFATLFIAIFLLTLTTVVVSWSNFPHDIVPNPAPPPPTSSETSAPSTSRWSSVSAGLQRSQP